MADESPPLTLLGDAVRRRWYVIVLVALATVAGAYAFTLTFDDYYDANAIVSFTPAPDVAASSDTVRVIMPKYSAYATSDRTLETVARTLGMSAADLEQDTSASIAPDSGNLTITVRRGSSREAARAANAIARETLAFARNDQIVDGVLTAPAVRQPDPSGPPRTLYLMASALVGLVLGVAAAFAIERHNPRLRTPAEVQRATGMRVIGQIPPSRRLRPKPVAALRDVEVGAAARTLRANVARLVREQPATTIAVTSATAREGKSTVAELLAAALARIDTNVLLIDGDIRRPRIGRDFEVSRRSAGGLISVLGGASSLEQEIRGSGFVGLSVLPTAPEAQGGDVLARRFTAVLDEAKRRFDLVIVDGSPILAGDDAITLVSACDAVLLVVSTETPTPTVVEGVNVLDSIGARVLGAVASRMKHQSPEALYGLR